jgi:hypothetical protein
MSLVREALAKAEREAAARAARERGLPERPDLAQPYRAPRRRRWPWAAAIAAATLAGAGTAYLAISSRDSASTATPAEPTPGAERVNRNRIPEEATAPRTEAPSRPQEPSPTGGRGVAADADPGVGEPPRTATPAEPAPEAERANRNRIPGEATAPRTDAPSRPQEPSPADGRGVAADADPGAGSPPVPDARFVGSYLRELPLGAGRALRLGGIAWSETAPVAYLNGRLRGVGEVVEGWEIVAVGRDHVVLAAGARRIELRLR